MSLLLLLLLLLLLPLLQGMPHSMATRVPIRRCEGESGPRAVIMPAASWPKHMGCWRAKVPFAPCEK